MDELGLVLVDNKVKTKKRKRSSKGETSGEGIDLLTDVKKSNDNHKEFDSIYLLNEAVKQRIENKYKNNDNKNKIIDIENLDITENSENTLAKLQKKSFRKKQSVKESVVTHSIPKSGSKSVKSNAPEKTSVECIALNKYKNRIICMDTNHQIECMKYVIELIRRDQNGSFRDALRQKAMHAIGLPVLPSGPNLVVKIIFNLKFELNFLFHFRNPDSPLDPTEELNHFNIEMFELSKIIYDLIRLEPKKIK